MSLLLLHGMQPLICSVDKNPKASPCREDIAALLGLNSASAVMSSPEPRAASLAFLPRPAPTLSLFSPRIHWLLSNPLRQPFHPGCLLELD